MEDTAPSCRMIAAVLESVPSLVLCVDAASAVRFCNRVCERTTGRRRDAVLGTAVTDLGPGGRVFVHGEYWDALADVPLATGDAVRVVGVEEGMRLRVERVS